MSPLCTGADVGAHGFAAIPAFYICPLTRQPFVNPVVLPDGHTYEDEAIREWIARHGTSPTTKHAMEYRARANRNLVRAYAEYCALHGALTSLDVEMRGEALLQENDKLRSDIVALERKKASAEEQWTAMQQREKGLLARIEALEGQLAVATAQLAQSAARGEGMLMAVNELRTRADPAAETEIGEETADRVARAAQKLHDLILKVRARKKRLAAERTGGDQRRRASETTKPEEPNGEVQRPTPPERVDSASTAGAGKRAEPAQRVLDVFFCVEHHSIHLQVPMSLRALVDALRAAIFRETGVAPERQLLIVNGRILERDPEGSETGP